MKRLKLADANYSFLLISIFMALGCESIAPMPRHDVNTQPDVSKGRIEQPTSIPTPAKTEIVGTVERVDKVTNEIQLRTTEAKVIVVKYNPATVVYSREREVGIDSLRPSDLILVRVTKTPQGDQYADLIRLNDRKER
jgi:hypothetical protein